MYDMHTHFVPQEVLRWLQDHQQTVGAKWEKKSPDQEHFLTVNDKWSFELKQSFTNPALYLSKQAEAGVSHSLISPIPQLFLYEFPIEITRDIVSVYNKSLAEWAHTYPSRISALAAVTLQNPALAAEELREAMGLGLKGAIIGPGTAGSMLSSDFYAPFWEEADRLGAVVFIHPLLSEDPRLKQRMMPNLIGVPWETTVCATDLLLSGLLDRYPDTRILLAHGGGFLPYQIGRLDEGYAKWKAVSAALQAPPSEYLRRFWFDSVLWNSDSLQALIGLVGEDRVVPGSDFPFDLTEWPPPCNHESGVKSLIGL